jgi:hypothetical protein
MNADRVVQCLTVALGVCFLFVFHNVVFAQTHDFTGDDTRAIAQYPSKQSVNQKHAGIGLTKAAAAPIIVDHACTDLTIIPQNWIQTAKANLHIAYGHTSHGSQLTDGMTFLVEFINNGGLGLSYPNNFFAWNDGGEGGALDLHDDAMGGDVGYYPDWVNNTHNYLGTPDPSTGRGTLHPNVNVIIWSWCGQVSGYTEQEMIDKYLTPMSALETEYPGIQFVYMTGHLDGTGSAGNLNVRNNQIRDYCRQNNKILYDFSDIESYDPDGQTHYMPLMCNDNCDYDSDGNGTRDRNWATDWQNSHTQNVDWYDRDDGNDFAHTQPLNANRKAYAAWWLWARLAGWNGGLGTTYSVSGSVTLNGVGLANVVMKGFPDSAVKTDANGYYSSIVNEGWSGTVRPVLRGYVFTPTHRIYNNVTTDQSNQHYSAKVRKPLSFLPLLLFDH